MSPPLKKNFASFGCQTFLILNVCFRWIVVVDEGIDPGPVTTDVLDLMVVNRAEQAGSKLEKLLTS